MVSLPSLPFPPLALSRTKPVRPDTSGRLDHSIMPGVTSFEWAVRSAQPLQEKPEDE